MKVYIARIPNRTLSDTLRKSMTRGTLFLLLLAQEALKTILALFIHIHLRL